MRPRDRSHSGQLMYPLTVKPAQSQRLDRANGTDWIAIGDAVAAFDPLSSMGIGHAMTCGCDVAVMLDQYLSHNKADALNSYQQGLERNFDAYLKMRQAYYVMEQRWPESPFWQRRMTVPSLEAIAT